MLPSITDTPLYRDRPLFVEVAVLTATLAAVGVWAEGLSLVTSALPLDGFGGSVGIWVHLALYVLGTALLVGGYAHLRGVSFGLSLPERSALPTAVLAVMTPAVLVLLTDALVGLFGGRYSALTGTRWTVGAPPTVVLTLAVLAPLVGSLVLALVFHGVVQPTLREVLSARRAALLTVGFGAVALVDGSGAGTGLGLPSTGGFVFLALVVVLSLVGRFAARYADSTWGRRASYAPLALLLAVGVYGVFGEVRGVADVAFVALQVAVLALAAWGYDRTDSLVVPFGTYGAFFLTGAAVAALLEAVPAPV